MSIYDHHGFFPRTVIFQLTLRCPLSCAHCIVTSGPSRREEMPAENAARWLDDIGRSGKVRAVALTGGEPFLNLGRLQRLLEAAERHDLAVGIVTSSSWAVSRERARDLLTRLPQVANLSLSADKYHLEFTPLENVKHSAEAALELGIEVGVFLCLENSEDDFEHAFRRFMGEKICSRIRIIRQYVHGVGRAAESAEIMRAVERVRFHQLPRIGCKTASAPVILPDGTVMACCGDTLVDTHNWQALRIGDLKTDHIADVLERAEGNPLLHALRVLGPKELAGVLAESGDPEAEKRFNRLYELNNICDICRDVVTDRSTLARIKSHLEKREVREEVGVRRLLQFGELPVL